MSENPQNPVPAGPVDEAGQAGFVAPTGEPPVAPATAVPATARPARRRRVGAIAGCVVLLAAVLGGAGYTVVTVQNAERDPGAPVWRLPKTEADKKVQTEATGLKGMLLPFGTSGYGRGPDMGEFGSDAELSGGQATELRKESLRNLPRSQRLRLEKEIDRQHIQGMAMRSYLSSTSASGSTAYAQDAFTVEIVLSRMESRRTVRSIAAFQQEFLGAMKVFRAGPTIEGHKNARCFLPPTDRDEKLDLMVCSAYEGDVLVSATVSGVKPLDKKGAAALLRAQLDRIGDPGEAV
ncbi:hypothetical protein [Streptomyces chiangmaiensis]|uniref:Secreted protein n=1 Tax=Streptomyces chiangmaiensis TaxID=766497 RepID=A0ABU7FH65_9ACTN|nr:hypothetical protein [Streptomyces chiangmaiensis]MED7822504.1 hypothetical protein [Streptomyces chiangmaiensis]